MRITTSGSNNRIITLGRFTDRRIQQFQFRFLYRFGTQQFGSLFKQYRTKAPSTYVTLALIS
jgi:hypothetical protein